MLADFSDLDRLLLVILVTALVTTYIARKFRNAPPVALPNPGEDMEKVARLEKRVAELEADVVRLKLAVDTVLQENAELREVITRKEELIVLKNDQITQLRVENEGWRRKANVG